MADKAAEVQAAPRDKGVFQAAMEEVGGYTAVAAVAAATTAVLGVMGAVARIFPMGEKPTTLAAAAAVVVALGTTVEARQPVVEVLAVTVVQEAAVALWKLMGKTPPVQAVAVAVAFLAVAVAVPVDLVVARGLAVPVSGGIS